MCCWFDFHSPTLIYEHGSCMADQFTTAERSAIMRQVRSVETAPEIRVREMIRRLGLRFRLHDKRLPGTPDFVFPRRKQVVFVHGCYWHQHKCERSKRPASNRKYWNLKLDRNMQRDKKNLRLLRREGWRTLTIWECQLREPERVQRRVLRFLDSRAA